MRRLLFIMIIVFSLCIPVKAIDITPPDAPESAQPYMPKNTESFSDGLWYIIKASITALNPSLAAGAKSCLAVLCIMLLVSVTDQFAKASPQIMRMVGIVAVGVVLFEPTNALVQLGTDAIQEINEYGKVLLPAMTAAFAAEGSITGSAALYTATTLFNSLLTAAISSLIIPMIYIFLCLSVASHGIGDASLQKLKDFCKWLMTWTLKIILYIFTGYISITGIVSGAADASALKAAKLTISGMVPVVGNILSDASEAVLVSAGLMKNAVGIYGLLAILACCMTPFIRIGVQYLLLKITTSVAAIFSKKSTVDFIQDFSGALGLLLGATASVCLLLLISTVCFMKGFG